jgi:hypothetical protein
MHTDLWDAVQKTDPKHTKQFNTGSFKGTAISPMWLIRRATEQWGPMGAAWGVRILDERVMQGAPLLGKTGEVIGHESIHLVQAEVFYPLGDKEGKIPCFGQTQFCGQRKDGRLYTDEEAPKKSLTDALTKGLSWLGFAADVHMGLFDDSKYVNRMDMEFRQEEEKTPTLAKNLQILRTAARMGTPALQTAWKMIPDAQKKLISVGEWESIKAEAKRVDETVDHPEEVAV